MKFLDYIAKLVIQGSQILIGFQPFISTLNPKAQEGAQKASDSLTEIGKIVAMIQVSGVSAGLTNEQKLKAAAPLVAKVIRESELFVGHSIPDDKLALFNAKVEALTSSFVDTINLLSTDGIKSKD